MAGNNNDQTIRIRFDVDTSGLRRGLDDARRGANDAGNGLRRLGDNNGIGKATSAVKGLTSSIGSAVKGAAGLVVGLAAIGGVKSILDGVINRVDAIHGGKKTMTILFDGDTKRAEKAINIVKDSVQGTPLTLNFGVGEMTKLVASGMDEATAGKTLQISMDVAATFDPGNVESMTGELNDIFSKIAAKGSMDMTHLDSLNTRGIPTLKLLAQHYGVSEEAAREMVKSGKVGTDDLNAALSGYEGAAKAAGDSIAGVFSNIKSNIIAAFATPFMDDDNYNNLVEKLQSVLTFVKEVMAPGIATGMTTAFEVLGKIGSWINAELIPPLKAVWDFVKGSLLPAFMEFAGWLGSNLAPVFSAAFEAGKAIIEEVVNQVKTLWEALQPLVEKLTEVGEAGSSDGFTKLKEIFEFMKDNAQPIASGIIAIATAFAVWKTGVAIFNGIMATYRTIMTLAAIAQWAFNAAMMANPIMWVIAAIAALIAIVALIIIYWEPIKEFFSNLWTSIKETATEMWEGFKEWITELWNSIVEGATELWNGLKEFFSELWTGIKETASEMWEGFKEWITELWDSVVQSATDIWNSLVEFFSNLWSTITEWASSEWEAFKELITNTWNAIVDGASAIWQALVEFFSNLWNSIKETASSIWEGIKGWIMALWTGIVSSATAIWNGLTTFFTTLWSTVKNLFTTTWDNIKSTLTNVWENIKSTATEKWNAVKDAMVKPVDKAKEAISKAIDKIKGFFSGLKLEFPKIKMPALPHFSLNGSFSLNPPSVPKLSVDWFATGGIATGPSVVGIGEAGSEAILPLSNKSKMKPFANAVAAYMPRGQADGNNNSGGNTYIINATIREEADIEKVVKAIERKDEKNKRAGGRKQ